MKKLLNIMLVIALIIPMTFFTVNAGEEETGINSDDQFVLSNKLHLTKEVLPYGEAIDRTYQVNLTVEGGVENIIMPADIFILIDMTENNIANYPMWPYYLRSIWNMCDNLVEKNHSRTFNFHLIAYGKCLNKQVQFIESYEGISHFKRKKLGNHDSLYVKLKPGTYDHFVDENGKKVSQDLYFDTEYVENYGYLPILKDGLLSNPNPGSLLYNYNKDFDMFFEDNDGDGVEEQMVNQSLFSGLLRISKHLLPSYPNSPDSALGGMDFPDNLLVSTDQLATLPGRRGVEGERVAGTSILVNTKVALQEMNRIIIEKNIGDSQAIMFNDTLPTYDDEALLDNVDDDGNKLEWTGDTYNEKITAKVLQRTYEEYEVSKKLGVIFHTFAINTFSNQQEQNASMWEEFNQMIGQNMIRDNKENPDAGTYKNGVYKKNNWKPKDSMDNDSNVTKYDNYESFVWDHEIGSGSTVEGETVIMQKYRLRKEINQKLITVSNKVGNGLTQVSNFANFVYVQDQIPKEFHVLNFDEQYKPYLSLDKDKKGDFEKVEDTSTYIERLDIFPSTNILDSEEYVPKSEERWNEESGVRWKLHSLDATNGIYKFTFFIKANEDYFGSEWVDANQDAAVYYMSYDQWVAEGSPSDDGVGSGSTEWAKSSFTKEDFVYQIEEVEEKYTDDNGEEKTRIVGKYKLSDPNDPNSKVKNPSKIDPPPDGWENPTDPSKKIDTCDINVYVPWTQNTSDGEVTIFYGDQVNLIKANKKNNTERNGWIVEASNNPSPNVNYYFDQFANLHEQDNYDKVGTKDEVIVDIATWKDKNGGELKFNYQWKVHTNEATSRYEEIISSGVNKSLNDIIANFTVEPDATVTYELKYWLSDESKDKLNLNTDNPKLGEWKPVEGTTQKILPLYDSTITNVFVNVEYGEIDLTKVLNYLGKEIPINSLEEMNLNKLFSVNVYRDNNLISSPNVKMGESTVVKGLKRGEYTLNEHLLQKYEFVQFDDLTREIYGKKDKSYSFVVGFTDEEKNIYQKNEIQLTNNYYLDHWYSSTDQFENQFTADEFIQNNSPSEVSNE